MKIAIVHDSLVEFGGAERVLAALIRIFPQADVYTAMANAKLIRTCLPELSLRRLHTSWIQPFPVEMHTSLIQLLSPLVWKKFAFDQYDLVLSHSGHLMSSLVHVNRAIHIVYIPSPPKNLVGIDPKTPLQYVLPYTTVTRALYERSLRRASRILVNSRHTQQVMQRRFNIKSHVLYPLVDIPSRPVSHHKGTYFLCVSRLDRGKNIELAIVACNRLHMPLKIIGRSNEPRYERYLRSIAGPTVKFLGFIPDPKLSQYYEGSIGFLFPSRNEDFGIAPLEAMAHGVPVVGFYAAGTKETVIEGETGTFFYHFSTSSLQKAMLTFLRMRFDPQRLREHAIQYDFRHFRHNLLHEIEEARKGNY